MRLHWAFSPTSPRSSLWQSSLRCWASAWQELVSEKPQQQAGPYLGAGDTPMPALSPGLGYPLKALAGAKTLQPHDLMGAAVCGLTDPHPQALHEAGSVSMLPLVVKGKPSTHQQDSMKPPMQNGWEGILQWGALSQGTEHMPQEQNAAVLEPVTRRSTVQWGFLACLPFTEPATPTVWSWASTPLFQQPAQLQQQGSQEREVNPVQPGITLMSTPGIWVPCQGLPPSVFPQTQHQNRSCLIFQMTWVTHCSCLLTWPASGEKMPPTSGVTLNVCLPPQSQAHQCCQRGIVTNGIPPPMEEPCLRLALPINQACSCW